MSQQFLVIPRSPFLGEWRKQPFVHFSIVFCLGTALQNWGSKSPNFLVFHPFRGILLKPAAFPLLIFVNTMLRSSVNCPTLMSSRLLIIFVIGFSMTPGKFPRRFLKCSFSFLIDDFYFSSHCALFCSLHLPSAMLFLIVCLLPSFWFYWLNLECILIVVFSMCQFPLSLLNFLRVGIF